MRRSVVPLPRAASALPILDISPYMSAGGCDASRRRTAQALDAACRDPGFFYLVGHGAPAEDIDRLHVLAKQFFAMPQARKEELALSRSPGSARGYQRLGENVTQGRRDWHEAIDLYAELDGRSVDLEALARPPGGLQEAALPQLRTFALGRNQWPDEPQAFRGAYEAHFSRMAGVGRALMRAMADAMGLPTAYFEPLTDRSFWCSRVIGYPPLQEAAGDDDAAGPPVGISCGEHTDYGCWTLLSTDDTPGALEVRLRDGSWIVADPMQGAFVVNLGDMLAAWTRHQYTATPHRVLQAHRGRYRTSVAYFFEPNFDAVIRPLHTAPGDELPSQPPPSTEPLSRAASGGSLIYGEHLFAKVSGNFCLAE